MSLIDVIDARLQALKDTSMEPSVLALDPEEFARVQPWTHLDPQRGGDDNRGDTGRTLLGLSVVIRGSPAEATAELMGRVIMRLPREAVAPKE